MKKRLCLLFVFIFCLFILSSLQPRKAYAYEEADDVITILKQYSSKYKDLKFQTGTRYTMYGAGCGVFSIAHAIQWISHKAIDSGKDIELLQYLLNMKFNTFDNMTKSLITLQEKDPTITYHQGALSRTTLTKEKARSIFNNNGAIICYIKEPGGHYNVAVGITDDGKYVQIVDSSGHSTIEKNDNYKLHIGYKRDKNGKFNAINYYTEGTCYWIPWECFHGDCTHARKFRNWWWISGYSSYFGMPNQEKFDKIRRYLLTPTEVNIYRSIDSSEIMGKKPANQGIIITGAYPKGFDNKTWYSVYGGGYIKATDLLLAPVESELKDFGDVKHANLSIEVHSKYPDLWLTAQPYADKDRMIQVNEKDPLIVTEVILNQASPRHYWVKVKYKNGEYYTCANNVECPVTTESTNPVSFPSGKTFPSGNLGNIKSFDLKGTVKCTYEIISATGGVYSSNYNFEKTINIGNGKTSFDLYSSDINMRANGGIAFGAIPDGSYEFRLAIQYRKTTWKNQSRDDIDPIQSIDLPAPPVTSAFTIKRDNAVAVTGITCNPSVKTIWIGEVFTVTPTIKPDNATNKKLTWSTSNSSVANVVDGKVTAVGKGTAIITAEAKDNSGKKATCTVTVKKPVTSISLSAPSQSLYVNGSSTTKLVPTILPTDASERGVKWSSSDASIVSVDQDGNITAKAVGSATITAKSIDGSERQGTCQINVLAYVDSVTLSGNGSVNVGKTIKLNSSVFPTNASNKNLIWSSSDNSIATVDSSGNVKGLKLGSVTITATANDRGTKKGTYPITIVQPVTGIEVNGSSSVLKGNTLSLTATIKPSDASNKTVSWLSENNNIATVSDGVVTGMSQGNVVIWASATDGSDVRTPFHVQVLQPVTSIAISGEEVVPVAGSIDLTATITPTNADNQEIHWTSSNSMIASVNSQGVVTGLQPGNVTITGTSTDGGEVSESHNVQVVRQVIAVKIEGERLVHTGNSVQLAVDVTSDEPLPDRSVTWSSSDASIVSVDSNGIITGIANGSATITATSNAESYYCARHQVTVDTLISNISLFGVSDIDTGSKSQIYATIMPVSATNKELIWSSSDLSVAIVDGNGLISAVSAGTATIEAKASDGSETKGTISITVFPLPSEISITGESALLVDTTTELSAIVLPASARNKSVSWSSSNSDVTTVNDCGVVTARGNGTAIITATAEGNTSVSSSHSITVTTLVSSVTLESPDIINVGDMGIVVADIQPVTASNQQLIWTSSNQDIAVVDKNGCVFGISSGYATITATATDGSGATAETEILIYQPIQSISVNVDPIAYTGQTIYPNAIVLPEDATEPNITWISDNEDIAVVQESGGTNGVEYSLKCVDAGVVKITAAAENSDVSGHTYLQVLPYTELMNNTASYTIYSDGNKNGIIGQASMTPDCFARAAADKYGALWSIDHINGNYAAVVGINENTTNYNGFALTNSVDVNLLRINHTGTDVYRVFCTVNEQTAYCDVTIHVIQPTSPLPESVVLSPETYNAQVGEQINISAVSPGILPSDAILPEGTDIFLYGREAFNRYAQVTKSENGFTVEFSKAGIYSAYVRYSGTNYQYDANVQFVITKDSGTVPQEVEKITIDNPVKYMLPGETSWFDISISPRSAEDTDLLWSSSSPDVVSVGTDGAMTALQTGTSIITVSSDNGVSATGFVAVTESLLSIDWHDEEVIDVYLGGNSKTVIKEVYLTSRASSQLTEAPTWSLKRVDGNNLTLLCEPIAGKDSAGQDLYGCAIILKSASGIGLTEYELTCSDGLYSTASLIKVNANETESKLPSMISWSNAVFSGRINELISIHPVIQCWPEETTLPNSAIVSFEGDQYWNAALIKKDYTISRNAMTFAFNQPGVYTANCIYSCSNMQYQVPITIRIADVNGVVPIRAASLTLNESEISVKAGDTVQLKAVLAPEDATSKAVAWSIEDPSVAMVDANGLVTGIADGRTNIWCTPEDTNCAAVKCPVVVEDEFTIVQTEEMSTQYLQGEAGHAIASFTLSNGTVKRIHEAGLEPVWSFRKVSGNAAGVDLIEQNGIRYLVATELDRAGIDTYEITCTAGEYTWIGRTTLTVSDLGSSVPVSIAIAQTNYSVAVGEEVELDFTPVCSPSDSRIPAEMRTNYIGVGQFYNGLDTSYKTHILTTRNDKVKVAFTKKGKYLLSRYYHDRNLTYISECTINVGDGPLNLLKCSDREATVYIGGKPGIAATCVISDTAIEELYGDELVWNAERLSGDCLHVALRADQSSASLYVADTTDIGEEVWRVSCTFRGITDYVNVTIQAVEPAFSLPETVLLRQSEFSGMVGNNVAVPLAVRCEPEGTNLPSIEDDAWSFMADGNTEYNASWSIANNKMNIRFKESGYYGGRLEYDAGNVTYSFPLSFAITDEESVLSSPEQMDVSLSNESMTVYPEGKTNVPIVNAVLSDSLDMYSLASIAAYAQSKDATWSLEILSGNACDLSIRKVSASSVQIILDSVSDTGNVNYRVTCAVEGHQYSTEGIIHVASDTEARPQAELKQTYFVTSVGTKLTIDASFYDKTSNLKLCAGKDSVWDNADAMAAMGYGYQESGDLLMPMFNKTGTYITTISNMVSNILCSQEIKIIVFNAKPLPNNPSMLLMPKALQVIDEEAFVGVKASIIDLRRTNVHTIKSMAFANNPDLMRVYIPSSVISISQDAFSGCSDFEIYCIQGSYADGWAQEMEYPVNYDMD